MRALLSSSRMMLRQVTADSMIIAICIAPLLAGIFFRFIIPEIEQFLVQQLHMTAVIEPYYVLLDLFLAVLTPVMFCFASSMIMLSELDERISSYLVVTPIGKLGYFISRLLMPAVLSSFLSGLLITLFSLTTLSWQMILSLSFLSALQACITSMIVVSFAKNKVEGLALAKLSGLMMSGLAIPFFIHTRVEYIFSPLPSYWMAKLAIENHYIYLIPILLSTGGWMFVLLKRFLRRFEL